METSFFEEMRRKRVPFGGSLEVTHRCNLRCAHCYQFAPREGNEAGPGRGRGPRPGPADPGPAEMGLDDYRTLLDQLKDAGCLFLSITGGEPLLRPDIMDILQAADERCFSFALQTNALLLDEAVADELAELANLRVEISLHAASAEKHDAFTGVPGSFQACLDAMDRLFERNVPVLVKTIVTSLNSDELDRMVELTKNHGAPVFFSSMVFPRNDHDTAPLRFRLNDQQLERFIAFQKRYDAEALAELMGEEGEDEVVETVAAGLSLPPGCGEPVIEAPDSPGPAGAPEKSIRACGAGLTTFCVNPYGDLYPCVAWPQVVGNVLEDGFPAVWRGSGLLEEIREEELNVCRECAICPILDKCPLCRALSFVEEGDAQARSRERCRQTMAWLEGMEDGRD